MVDHRCGLGDLLQVVEHQQGVPVLQVLLEVVQQGTAGCFIDTQDLRDGGDDHPGIGNVGEGHEKSPVTELMDHLRGQLQREPRLPYSSRPREREKPHTLVEQGRAGARQLLFPADERRGLWREVVGMRVERAQRRKGFEEVTMQNLE